LPQNVALSYFLPRVAALRRAAAGARQLAKGTGDPVTKTRLQNEAENFDRQADEAEVRLHILKTALGASEPARQKPTFQI
jgi:hypothetical protein